METQCLFRPFRRTWRVSVTYPQSRVPAFRSTHETQDRRDHPGSSYRADVYLAGINEAGQGLHKPSTQATGTLEAQWRAAGAY